MDHPASDNNIVISLRTLQPLHSTVTISLPYFIYHITEAILYPVDNTTLILQSAYNRLRAVIEAIYYCSGFMNIILLNRVFPNFLMMRHNNGPICIRSSEHVIQCAQPTQPPQHNHLTLRPSTTTAMSQPNTTTLISRFLFFV